MLFQPLKAMESRPVHHLWLCTYICLQMVDENSNLKKKLSNPIQSNLRICRASISGCLIKGAEKFERVLFAVHDVWERMGSND